MRHFAYRDGELHAEGVPLRAIAEAVGTPTYVYSTATLERHYKVFKDALGDARVDVFALGVVLWELYTTLVGEFSPTGVFRVNLC